ncbi:MAG: ROK family protein [Gammaproteobacteria bacterium]|nr:ROK family protein [Gammaproteobacteria bacterium]
MRIGVDLGGTKIEAIALDGQGEILARQRVATPAGDYAATLRVITELVLSLERTLGQNGSVGIATPGAIAPDTGRLKNANSVCLNGQPLQTDLETALQRSVRLANDADCFALSEATDGAAAGALVVFGVIVGTGTGGGIVINGQLLRGANAIAGEWGHNPLPWVRPEELPGPECYCGRRGCIETFLSGPGLAQDYAAVAGELQDVTQIVSLAEAGNAVAEASLQRYEQRMARALAAVINLLDPEVIVLGGGLCNVARWYRTVPALWGEFVFSTEAAGDEPVRTRLVPPKYGDSSGVRGAAWLWGESDKIT